MVEDQGDIRMKEERDNGMAPGVIFRRSWPNDRWSAGFAPKRLCPIRP